jgi:hypothetical protein
MSHRIIIAVAGAAALGSALIGTSASAAQSQRQHPRYYGEPLAWSMTGDAQCRVVGTFSHRCYSFISDTTWPEGHWGNHRGNGG